MKWFILTASLLLMLSSCRQVEELTGHRPIVDTKGVDPDALAVDMADCYTFADEVQSGRQVIASAGTAAVVGGVIGAAVGNSQSARRGAGVGAASGTLSGSSGTA